MAKEVGQPTTTWKQAGKPEPTLQTGPKGPMGKGKTVVTGYKPASARPEPKGGKP